ncbi:MAG: hypothetical protein ABDH49_08975 [Candidatus Hydrothermales bacterium]
MEIKNIIKNLVDPLGIPSFPFLFQFLMVLTFVIHILFVNLTLGSVLMSLFLSFKKDEYSKKLSSTLIRATPFFISMSILFGIAPLLFVQVIYDAFFYTASVLLGLYVVLFIFAMMLGYTLIYISYFKKEKNENLFKVLTIISFVLFLFSGFVMHAISYLSLIPEKWMEIFTSSEPVNTSGTQLKHFQISRFLHFIIPSFLNLGIFLMLYSEYYKDREDIDKKYIDFVYTKGAKLSFYFIILQILIGLWFLLEIPAKFNFYLNPLLIVGVLLSLILAFFLYKNLREKKVDLKVITILSLLTLFFMSYSRESLRTAYLSQFDYSIFNYKVNLDIGSLLLFLLTFIMGLVVISFLIYVPYRAGKTKGIYSPTEKVYNWGKIVISLMIIWLIVMVILGIFITINNTL